MKELVIEEDVTDTWKKNQYVWEEQYFELEDNKVKYSICDSIKIYFRNRQT